MAKIDQLLKAVINRGAGGLVMVGGEQPLLKFGGAMEPLTENRLTKAQIMLLLQEILKEATLDTITSGRPASFDYVIPDAAAFKGKVKTSAGMFTVAISPEEPPEPEKDEDKPEPKVEVLPVAPAEPPPEEPPVPADLDKFQFKKAAAAAPPEELMDRLLRNMVSQGASDLHLRVSHHPLVRVDGWMFRLREYPKLTEEQIEGMMFPMMPQRIKDQFDELSDTDFAIELPDVSRFRVNCFRDRHGTGAVFRQIPSRIMTPGELGISKAIRNLAYLSKGLVVVTGPTGSGKSTTLATMVDLMNERRQDHIITIEDPIEFIHTSKKCLVTQREVGEHTSSFKHALRAALRMDPDIVLVGEMRDLETIAIAIETAVTGHLVFGTLHTATAVQTVDRIIDQFPGDRQQQIRVMLADSLKAVIAQTLLRRRAGGRIAAYEILLGNRGVSNLIREGKTYQLQSVLQTSKEAGMTELNQVLVGFVKKGIVDAKEAYMKSIDREQLLDLFDKHQIKAPFLNR